MNTTDGTHNFASASEPSGDYNLNVSENTYTTSVVGLPSYFSVTPNEAVDTFVGFGQTEQQDFCIQAATVANDLNVSINPQFSSVPGGFGEYNIVYQNAGTTTLNGEVTMILMLVKCRLYFQIQTQLLRQVVLLLGILVLLVF